MTDILGFIGDILDISFTIGTATVSIGLMFVVGAVIGLAMKLGRGFSRQR